MNCRDFEQVWNRVLDYEPRSRRLDVDDDPTSLGDLEESLREHAEVCEVCRARQLEFETLREALRAWSDRPRVLEIGARSHPTRRGRAWVAAVASAMAAAVVAAVAILPPGSPSSLEPIVEAPSAPVAQRDLLGEAVDDATAASWHLAQLAAEPAAWLSREIIDASFSPTEIETRALEIAYLDPPADSELGSIPDASAPGLFRGMGRYLSAGVEPVSTSAREAFGFLRPPTPQ